eukprot:3864976-Amphidinium_carterae.1
MSLTLQAQSSSCFKEEHRQVDMATHDERSSESKDDGFSTAPVDASNRIAQLRHNPPEDSCLAPFSVGRPR